MTNSNKGESTDRMRGEHSLNVFVSLELKERVQALARKYDRTNADIMRAILRIGIPMMEGISQAEETMVKEYVQLFRRLRQVKSLKEI
jgi:predicted DNA-binding protein